MRSLCYIIMCSALPGMLSMCRMAAHEATAHQGAELPGCPADTMLPLALRHADSLVQWRDFSSARSLLDSLLKQGALQGAFNDYGAALLAYILIRDQEDAHDARAFALARGDSGQDTQHGRISKVLQSIVLGYYYKNRNIDSAEYYFDHAYQNLQSAFFTNDPRAQRYCRDVASFFLFSTERVYDAMQLLQREEALHKQWHYPAQDRFVNAYHLGVAHRTVEDQDLAASYFKQALTELRQGNITDSSRWLLPYAGLCFIAADQNASDRLDRYVDTTLVFVHSAMRYDTIDLLDYYASLAMCYAPGYTDRPARGLEVLEAVLSMPFDTVRYAVSYAELLRARAYLERTLYPSEKARRTMEQAIAVYETAMPFQDNFYTGLYADAKLALGMFMMEDDMPVSEALPHVNTACLLVFGVPLHILAEQMPVRSLRYYPRWHEYLLAYGNALRDHDRFSELPGLCMRIDSAISTTRQKISDHDMLRNARKNHLLYTKMTSWCHDHNHIPGRPFLPVAFDCFEKSRAHLLLAHMSTARLAAQFGVPQEIIEEGRKLTIEELALHETQDVREMDAVLGRKQAYFQSLAEHYPDYYHTSYQPARTTLKAMRSALGHEEAVLMYQLHETQLYAFVMTTDTVALERLDFSPECEVALNAFYLQASERPAATETRIAHYAIEAQKVFDCVLSSVFPLIRQKRQWWISADGMLERLPFEALLTDGVKSNLGFNALPYLIHQYDIGYFLSATTWIKGQETGSPDINTVAVFVHSDGTHEVRSAKEQHNMLRYQGMPGTAKAAKQITEIYGSTHVKTWRNMQATHRAFFDALPVYDALHLGLHAYADTTGRQAHGIVFPGDQKPLTVSDVIGGRIKASVVFLEGCETGAGRQYPGEGTLNLARPFIAAGATHVLASRWKLDDRSAAVMSGHFYRHLKDGAPVTRAKCEAKRAFLKNASRLHSHPYYWAAVMSVQ